MTEPAKNKAFIMHLTVEEHSAILQDAVKLALKSTPKEDRLLTVEQVCDILSVKPGWVYHNMKKLPFVRKVGGMLRFSSNGLQRYIESAKFTVKGG